VRAADTLSVSWRLFTRERTGAVMLSGINAQTAQFAEWFGRHALGEACHVASMLVAVA
jgi:hypothetical protein